MKKRIIALLLIIIMLVAFMPTTAIAHKGTYKKHDHSNIFNNTRVYVAVEGEGGKIYSPKDQYGTKIIKDAVWTFTAVPDPGYYCSGWYVPPECPYYAFTEDGDTLSIKIVKTSTTYKAWARFEKKPETTLNLGDGGVFTSTSNKRYTTAGAPFEEITYVPPYTIWPGYKFVGWDRSLEYGWPEINAKYEYLVTFVENDPHMTIIGNNPVWTVNQRASAPDVSVDPGYRYDGWNWVTIDGPTVITAKPCVQTAGLTRNNVVYDWNTGRRINVRWTFDVGTSVRLNDLPPEGIYGWEFVGWIDDNTGQNIGKDPTVTVLGECSYTAKFERKEYTVTYETSSGSVLGTEIVKHDHSVTKTAGDFTYSPGKRPASSQPWEGMKITSNTTITVNTEYEVTFDPNGGRVESGDTTQWVAYGGDAVEPDITPPAAMHWSAAKWSSAFTNVTAPVNTVAQYDDNIYTVSLVDQNGAPYSSPQSIVHGSDAIKPTLDDPTGTRFDANDTAWEADFLNVTEDREVTVALEYKVKFDPNGGTVESGDLAQWVVHSGDAAEPNITPPTGKHWARPKWDNAYTNVTTPVDVTAQYEDNVYTVSFVDQNGDAYNTPQTIVHGNDAVKPVLDDPTGTRFDVNDTAWEAELVNVTEDRKITVALEYKVEFDPNGGTVESGNMAQWVAHGEDAVEPDITPPIGKHWAMPKWDNTITNVTASIDASAQYEDNVYTVTFVDQNGVAYSAPQNIVHGNDAVKPVLDDPIGTRFDISNTAWEANLLNVTENREITVALEYLVTYDVSPGTSTDPNLAQWMPHGGTATEPTLTEPTGYDMDGWDSTHGPIDAPKTISANYVKEVYTVTIKDEAGNVLATEQVAYQDDVLTTSGSIALPSGVRFASTAWDAAEATGITGDTTIFANTEYLVSFVVAPGTSSDPNVSQWVSYGGDAVIPLTTPPTGNHFADPAWSSDTTNITSTTTVLALYDINEYTVSFMDYDGSAISAVTVNHGSAAASPSNPSRTGWTFTGWDIVLDPITNDVTATARYTINTYTVTFVDYDGTVIDEQMVDWNTGATAPADPTRDGFTFTGWDTEFNAITEDLMVTALYEEVVVLEPEEDIPQTNVQDDGAVIEQEDTPHAKSATMFPWWWILIGVGGAALLFFLLFFWKRRKKDEQET